MLAIISTFTASFVVQILAFYSLLSFLSTLFCVLLLIQFGEETDERKERGRADKKF